MHLGMGSLIITGRAHCLSFWLHEQRRRLTSLVYLDGILPVNIATVIAVRSFFFNGCSKCFYDEEILSLIFDVSSVMFHL